MGETCKHDWYWSDRTCRVTCERCKKSQAAILDDTTRELEAARAQVAELTRWKREANAAVDSLATAVEALEWYAQTHPSSSLYSWDRARRALAAIRAPERTAYAETPHGRYKLVDGAWVRAPETQPECTCNFAAHLMDINCPQHGRAAEKP